MTMRLDIVTNDAGELVRREHARELGAGVVVALYRLIKLAQMHDLANQAFQRQLEQTHQLIGEYCLRAGAHVNILFALKAVFVAGQLLKGNRSAYEAATELGAVTEQLGGSEIFVQRDITREELHAFAEQISLAFRTGMGNFRCPTPKIRIRRVADAARLRGIDLEDLTTDQRIVRTYASAVVVLRRFYEDLVSSRYILPRRIKRIAQSLVDLSEGSTPAFLGVTEVRNANFDEAGRAVNTAILAVTMAREVTQERTILAQIAMAGMMFDVARPRALALAAASGPAMPGMAGPTSLSEDQEDRLAAGTAAVLTALGRVNEPSITRTVLAFEALWLRRQTWLGPVYWGMRPPTLHAKIIGIARRYNDLLTPEPGLMPPTPDFAVAQLSVELTDPQDRIVLRMLVSALGLLPMGTVVLLSTGEMAEVVRGPRGPGERPRVKIVKDAAGTVLDPAPEVELAQDPRRTVSRVVSVDGWRKGLETAGDPAALDGYDPDAQDAAPAEPAPPAVPPPMDSPRSRADQYADQFAAWGTHEREPSHAGAGGSVSGSGASLSSEQSSSLPSMGSSPSAVAEAMGRMINDSLRPPAAPAMRDIAHDRTMMQPEAADRPPARPASPAGAARAPTARGDLASTPLPHVLVYMLDHSLTGSVVFEAADGEDIIIFSLGVPKKVRLRDGLRDPQRGSAVGLLGEMLVHAGALDPKKLDQAVEGARRMQILLGEYLVGHDLVSREALAWALEAQLLEKIAHLANIAPDVTYAYYRDVDLLEGWGGGDVTVSAPLNPILASVRNWMDRARIRATLSRIGKHPLVLSDMAELGTLALTPEEQAVLDVVRTESLPLPQLFKRDIANEESVSSLVYALAVTRQFAFKGQKKGPMAARGGSQWRVGPRTSVPPAALSGEAPGPMTNPAVSPRNQKPLTPSASGPRPNPLRPPEELQRTADAPASARKMPAQPAVTPGAPPPRAIAPAARPMASALPPARLPQIRPIAGKKPTVVGLQPAAPAGARPSVRPAPAAPVVPDPAPGDTPADEMKTTMMAAPAFRTPARAPVPLPSRAKGQAPAPTTSGSFNAVVARPAPAPPDNTEEIPLEVDDAEMLRAKANELSGEGLEDAEAAIEAMTSFRLAEAALQRNDIAGARSLAEKAAQLDPSQPDYQLLGAWIRALGDDGPSVADAMNVMSQVLSDDPSNERALLYRARLLVRGRRFDEALVDYNELLSVNPRHRDAAAELKQLKQKMA